MEILKTTMTMCEKESHKTIISVKIVQLLLKYQIEKKHDEGIGQKRKPIMKPGKNNKL